MDCSLFKPNPTSSPLLIISLSRNPFVCRFNPPRRFITMATTNNAPEINDPPTKLPKLHENGVHQLSQRNASFFRVKKLSENAVIPTRGSPLSAGYDLSRYKPMFFFVPFFLPYLIYFSYIFSDFSNFVVRRIRRFQPEEKLWSQLI